jgi:hypothetical protein
MLPYLGPDFIACLFGWEPRNSPADRQQTKTYQPCQQEVGDCQNTGKNPVSERVVEKEHRKDSTADSRGMSTHFILETAPEAVHRTLTQE